MPIVESKTNMPKKSIGEEIFDHEIKVLEQEIGQEYGDRAEQLQSILKGVKKRAASAKKSDKTAVEVAEEE